MTLSQHETQTHTALQQLPTLLAHLNTTLKGMQPEPEKVFVHFPAIAPLDNGSWGTICMMCTDQTGAFQRECLKGQWPDLREQPPAVLWPDNSTDERHAEAVKLVRGRIQDVASGGTEHLFLDRLLKALMGDE